MPPLTWSAVCRRLALIALVAAVLATPARAEEPAAMFGVTDPQQIAAMTKARARLPDFLELLASADLSDGAYMVKWARPLDGTSPSHEHIWVHVLEREPGWLGGVLANEPKAFVGRKGQPVVVPLDQITDWSWWDDADLLHGAWTTRVMLPGLSAADRDYFNRVLAPLPE